MRDWTIGLGAILIAAGAQGQTPSDREPVWLTMKLQDGVELRYVPLVVTLQDYPRQALRADEEGTTILNLQVDAAGLRNCSTALSSGSTVLDEQACRLYRTRGRFDLRGTSEPVTVRAPVQWTLVD